MKLASLLDNVKDKRVPFNPATELYVPDLDLNGAVWLPAELSLSCRWCKGWERVTWAEGAFTPKAVEEYLARFKHRHEVEFRCEMYARIRDEDWLEIDIKTGRIIKWK